MSKACELRSASYADSSWPSAGVPGSAAPRSRSSVDFDDLGGRAEREDDQPLVPWGVRSRRLVGLAVMLRDPTIRRLRI
jgi:hypothetical protein